MLGLWLVLLLQGPWVIPPSGAVALDGAWRVHAGGGDVAAYATSAYDDASWASTRLPLDWPDAGPRPQGFVWYRGRYVVREAPAGQLGLRLAASGVAVEVYVDGEPAGGVGAFPPDYRVRSAIPVVLPIPLTAVAPGPHVIAVRAYSEEPSGSLGPVAIAPLGQLDEQRHASDLFMLGTAVLFLGLGVYQLFFWARRREAREHLFVFLFCACLTLFFVVWMPSVQTALAPGVDWLRLYLAFAAAAIAALAMGVRGIFEVEPEAPAGRAVGVLGAAFAVIVVLALLLPQWNMVLWLEQWVYNPAVLVSAGVLVWLAATARRRGLRHARALVWGSGILALTVLHDVVRSWGMLPDWGSSTITVQYGGAAFVLSIALATAGRFAETQTTALTDRLTGLYRREVVMDALAREIRRAARIHQPLTVIMMDVDHFKAVNDSLGHPAGDRVLAEIGRRLAVAGRAVDWLGRYGGEEFLAILAATGESGGLQAAERFRAAVSALPIEAGRAARTVTLSAGLARYDGGEEWPTAEQLVGAADAALYRAKDAGRNRSSA